MISCIFIIGIGAKDTTSALIKEKVDKCYIISSLQGFNDEEGIAKCDCGISFKQHKETFELKYNQAFLQQNFNNIVCDCGGILKEK